MFNFTVFKCIFFFLWLHRCPTVAQLGDATCCLKVADVAFVVDTSSSIYIEDFKLQIKSIHSIVNLFDVGPDKARFAAVSFSDRVVPEFNFNSFSTRSQVLNAIGNIRYPGGQLTCLNLGLEYMRRILFNSVNGARHGVPQVVVVFTDGNINCGYDSLTSTKAKDDTIKEADVAKRSGLSMFTVGIGPNMNMNVLKAISSAPSNRFMQTVPSDSKMDTTHFRHFITKIICTGCGITPWQTLKPVITGGSIGPPTVSPLDYRINPPPRSRPGETGISPATRSPPGDTRMNPPTRSTPGDTRISPATRSRPSDTRISPATRSLPGDTRISPATRFPPGDTRISPATRSLPSDTRISPATRSPPSDTRNSPDTRSSPGDTRISPAIRSLPDIPITTSVPVRKPCPPTCQKKTVADIYFVLGESTSIYAKSNFRRALVFVEDVIKYLQIGPTAAESRVGMIRYSDRAFIEFPLYRYTTKAQVQNAVRSVTYKGGGSTNTHMALQLLRSLFTSSYLIRNNVAKIAIIITDGKSTNPFKTREESQLLQRMGIYSFAMGSDYITNEEELDVIATCDLYKIKIDYFASSTINRRFADILCNDAGISSPTRFPPDTGITPPTRFPPSETHIIPQTRSPPGDNRITLPTRFPPGETRINPPTRSPPSDTRISFQTRSPPGGAIVPLRDQPELPLDRNMSEVRLNCTPGNVENYYCNRCVYNSKCELLCTKTKCMIQKSLLDKVNSNRNNSWNATAYRKFWNLTLEYGVMTKLGTTYPTKDMLKLMKPTPVYDRNTTLPKTFSAREKWPGYIHPPEDQGNCGGSWAFSTAGVVADRIAIQSKGSYTRNISTSHLLSCALKDDGCSAGSLDIAWQYITNKDGILVSECYTRIPLFSAGVCYRSFTEVGSFCPDEFLLYIRMTPPKRIANKEEDIMTDIMKNGPVQTIINVKEDFFMYKSGIYRYSTNSGLDDIKRYHSVRIIGWGEKKIDGETIKYWECANSWGVDWGEEGFFKIERSAFENFTLSANLARFRFVENQEEPDCNRAPQEIKDLHNSKNNAMVEIVKSSGGGHKAPLYSEVRKDKNNRTKVVTVTKVIQISGRIRGMKKKRKKNNT